LPLRVAQIVGILYTSVLRLTNRMAVCRTIFLIGTSFA
jgi:hypothetical protein